MIACAVMAACSGESFAPPPGFQAPPPSTVVNLAPGEFVTLTGSQAVDPIDFPEASDTRAYAIAVQNVSTAPGSDVAVRAVFRRQDLVSLSEGHATGSRTPRPTALGRPAEGLGAWRSRGEIEFRRETARRIAGARVASQRSGTPPVVGDTIRFRSPIDPDGSVATCSAEETIAGVVRSVGPNFAFVEDTVFSGDLTPADYQQFVTEAEQFVKPVGEAYFGPPSDIDGNRVVLVLLTHAVNRLGAAGFFTASDLTDVQDCSTSNQGEVLWLVGPDPFALHGAQVDPQTVRDRTVGTVAHELQHLVHAGRRIFEGGGTPDSRDVPWLNEGLSHIAEEVTGLYAAGLRTGNNLDLASLPDFGEQAVFRKYHLGNFSAVRDYFEETASVPALVTDPVTNLEFRRARGFGYLFLRWLADQYANTGPQGIVSTQAEEAFFRSLALGGPGLAQSTANIQQALAGVLGVNQPWNRLFGDYASMPLVDDFAQPQVPVPGVLELTTWNLPAAFESARMNGFEPSFPNGFPLEPPILRPETLEAVGFTSSANLRPSTALYFRIESARSMPLTRLSLLSSSGQFLTAGQQIQVTIVRMF